MICINLKSNKMAASFGFASCVRDIISRISRDMHSNGERNIVLPQGGT